MKTTDKVSKEAMVSDRERLRKENLIEAIVSLNDEDSVHFCNKWDLAHYGEEVSATDHLYNYATNVVEGECKTLEDIEEMENYLKKYQPVENQLCDSLNHINKFNVYANNFEYDFIRLVWADNPTLRDHLYDKWDVLMSKLKTTQKVLNKRVHNYSTTEENLFEYQVLTLTGTTIFYEFFMMLDSSNKDKLNTYIINHKNY